MKNFRVRIAGAVAALLFVTVTAHSQTICESQSFAPANDLKVVTLDEFVKDKARLFDTHQPLLIRPIEGARGPCMLIGKPSPDETRWMQGKIERAGPELRQAFLELCREFAPEITALQGVKLVDSIPQDAPSK